MAIVHFENLWEKAEQAMAISSDSDMEILGKISSVVDEIRDIYKASANSKDKNLVQGMKSKAVGRLLFNITALSGKEKIDVYASLKDQLDISSLKDKFIF